MQKDQEEQTAPEGVIGPSCDIPPESVAVSAQEAQSPGDETMNDAQRARIVTGLVQEHYSLLYRFAFRLTGSANDAEDLTQQTFLTAQTKVEQLREPDRARGWLCAILRNAWRKVCRHEQVLPAVSLDSMAELTGDEGSAELEVDSEVIQTVLNELPPEQRSPLVLFYFQELSYKEIAELEGVPIGTIMSRLARGKAYLRGRLRALQPALTEH